MRKCSVSQLLRERDRARTRYGAAVAEFRESYTQLAALDAILRTRGIDGAPGFGPTLNVVELRHAAVNPDESGSIQSDIIAIIEQTEVDQ
jgi:hypothetical protein